MTLTTDQLVACIYAVKDFKTFEARYSGSGDSGGIESIAINNKEPNQHMRIPIENALITYVSEKFPGWEINEGSKGVINISINEFLEAEFEHIHVTYYEDTQTVKLTLLPPESTMLEPCLKTKQKVMVDFEYDDGSITFDDNWVQSQQELQNLLRKLIKEAIIDLQQPVLHYFNSTIEISTIEYDKYDELEVKVVLSTLEEEITEWTTTLEESETGLFKLFKKSLAYP